MVSASNDRTSVSLVPDETWAELLQRADFGPDPSVDKDDLRLRVDIVGVAQELGIRMEQNGTRWEARCPWHNDSIPSFYAWTGEDGVQRVTCHPCDYVGDVFDLVRTMRGCDFPAAKLYVEQLEETGTVAAPPPVEREQTVRDFTAEATAWHTAPDSDDRVAAFLAEKAPTVPEGWARAEFRIGVTPEGKVTLPYVNPDGSVHAVKTRGADTDGPWHERINLHGSRLRTLYGAHRLRAGTAVLLCEGESDTLTAAYHCREAEDLDVLGLPGAQGPRGEWLELLAGRTVLLALDPDGPGRGAAAKWADKLEDVLLVELEHDVTASGPEALERALAVAKPPVTPEPVGLTYVDGATFLFTEDEAALAVWGSGDDVLWSSGEPFLVVGPAGVGKSTIMQQVTLARIGLGRELLGYPVERTSSRVLYLASDRPKQIRRSMRRMVRSEDADVLRKRLVIWPGPLAADIAKDPLLLLRMAREAGADTIVVDSLKDVTELSTETGTGVALAFGHVVANGVELAVLHHQRKAQSENRKPKTLADVYGSRMIPDKAGSVVLLWGAAGDVFVEMTHLKQPVDVVGPLNLQHHKSSGRTVLDQTLTLEALAARAGGISAAEAAAEQTGKVKADRNAIEQTRRKLERLVKAGRLRKVDGSKGGGNERTPTRYYPAEGAS